MTLHRTCTEKQKYVADERNVTVDIYFCLTFFNLHDTVLVVSHCALAFADVLQKQPALHRLQTPKEKRSGQCYGFHLTVFLVFVLCNHLVYNSGINSCKYIYRFFQFWCFDPASLCLWFFLDLALSRQSRPRVRVWPLHFFSGGPVGSTVPITERMWPRHLCVAMHVSPAWPDSLRVHVCVCERVCWGASASKTKLC